MRSGRGVGPLYTQLQHRAPKESKGNVVSASNFLNVVGGIVAVAFFYALTFAFERMLGPNLDKQAALSSAALLPGLVATGRRPDPAVATTLPRWSARASRHPSSA